VSRKRTAQVLRFNIRLSNSDLCQSSGIMVHTVTKEEEGAGAKAEHLFRDYCDRAGITYLFIEQSSYSKSSKLVREQAGRPDFLVLEPYKMPFFLDVKARQFVRVDGRPTFFLDNSNFEAARLNVARELLPLRRFQNFVGIPVWVAWFERVGSEVRPGRMHVVPINVLSNFRGPASWEWLAIPLDCCTSIDLNSRQLLSYNIEEQQIQKFVELLRKYISERGWKEQIHSD